VRKGGIECGIPYLARARPLIWRRALLPHTRPTSRAASARRAARGVWLGGKSRHNSSLRLGGQAGQLLQQDQLLQLAHRHRCRLLLRLLLRLLWLRLWLRLRLRLRRRLLRLRRRLLRAGRRRGILSHLPRLRHTGVPCRIRQLLVQDALPVHKLQMHLWYGLTLHAPSPTRSSIFASDVSRTSM
jgi:hypothetical protein